MATQSNFHTPVDGIIYCAVAQSQTGAKLTSVGGPGGAGDYLGGILIVPATTSPGAVSIGDGGTSITIFAGGAGSVLTLAPFFVPLGVLSVNAAWTVTTGLNVSIVGVGQFA